MMKNVFLFLGCCLFALSSCSEKRPAVIERPIFETWSSSMIEIDRIEMTDSLTTLHMKAYIEANGWVRIDKNTYIKESGTDDKLVITGSDGIKLDEERKMPESGEISFKLYFPPLKPNITKIDFIESDCADCFKIWGIHLMPSAKLALDPIAHSSSTTNLAAPKFSSDKAIVTGQLKYLQKGASTLEASLVDPITQSQKEIMFDVSDDGHFSTQIPIGFPGTIYISGIGVLYIEPGKETQVTIDLARRGRLESRLRNDKEVNDSLYVSIIGSGPSYPNLQKINTYYINFDELMKLAVDMTPIQFRDHLMSIYNTKATKIKQTEPSEISQLLCARTERQVLGVLLRYNDFMKAAYRRASILNPKIAKPELAYYSLIGDLLQNCSSNMQEIAYNVSLLRNVPYFSNPVKQQSPSDNFAYFKEAISPLLGANKAIILELAQAQFFGDQLAQLKVFTDAEKDMIRKTFAQNEAYANSLIAQSDALSALIEKSKDNKENVVNAVPNVDQAKVFETIMANYKGKVVVVDFWATWCGPCIGAMKAMKPFKAEMKGKDVVFLYLTNETSPLNKWHTMISDIDGQHYRVNDAQWAYWSKIFNIQGIPTIMVYDKQGKQVFNQVGFPGVEELKKTVNKVME